GALEGFTAFASGLKFVLIRYYRDKGYGVGSRIVFIAGLVGGTQEEIRDSGATVRDTPENAAQSRRGFRYLLYDPWGMVFVVPVGTDPPPFRRHLSGARVPTDSGVRQLPKPPRDDHPVRGDLPQSAAAETRPAEVVVVCGLAPERGLLRVFLHQLRIERSPIPVLG